MSGDAVRIIGIINGRLTGHAGQGVFIDILRQKGSVILGCFRQGQFFKDVAQIGIGLQPIGFGGFDQTEKGGLGSNLDL